MKISDSIKDYLKADLSFEEICDTSKISKEELNSLRLPKRFSTVEMAERIRVPLKSNVLARIDLSLTPYLIDPIRLIADPTVAWVFIIAPTQSGKTVFLQTVVADTIAQNPGTLLYIFPDENNGKAALKEKVINMITETPFLMEHTVPPLKTNLSTKQINLDNMTIYPGWSGSLGTLSSKPAKIVVLDEIRLMKLMVGSESNAIKLASDRLTTFSNFGLAQAYGVSSPATKGDLLYQQMFIPGTVVSHWHVKCKNCEKYFVPMFFHMLRDSGEGTANLHCPICKNRVEEGTHKRILNKDGAYGLKKKHFGLRELPPIKELKKGFDRVVFRFCSMSSPFRSFQTYLNEYYKTKGNIGDFKNFKQCWMAEFWEDDISETSEELLKERVKKGMLKGKVPLGTKFLTAGVDAQDAGFYVNVWAWGDGVRHLVDSYFIECHKDTTNFLRTRKILEIRLDKKKWSGWMLAAWAIDIADGDRQAELRAATSTFQKCYNIIGATNSQVVNIEYKSRLNYYCVKRAPYLEETEKICKDSQYSLYESPDQDFFTQFPNTRKIKEVHQKTGEEKIIWKKCGQDDYRAAATYAFECLDFLYDGDYTLRDMIDVDGFILNPAIIMTRDESDNLSKPKAIEKEYFEDDMSPYESMEGDNWFKGIL